MSFAKCFSFAFTNSNFRNISLWPFAVLCGSQCQFRQEGTNTEAHKEDTENHKGIKYFRSYQYKNFIILNYNAKVVRIKNSEKKNKFWNLPSKRLSVQ